MKILSQPTDRWTTTTASDDGTTGGGQTASPPPPPPPPPPAGDGGAAEKPFYEAFTREALKTSPAIQKFKTAEDLADGYTQLEKRFGIDPARRIDLPADPNDKDGMRAVYAKLGLPEKPEGYGLTLDDKASDTDKALLGEFVKSAHEAGMPASMAKVAFEFWQKAQAGNQQAAADAFTAQAAEGKAALEKEWGGAYTQKSKEIGNAILKYGDKDLVDELAGEKLGNYPNLAKMLGKMIDRMAEPGGMGGQGGDADTGARIMTPAQAKAAITTLEGDPVKGKALREASHAMHKAVVAERTALLRLTEPENQ